MDVTSNMKDKRDHKEINIFYTSFANRTKILPRHVRNYTNLYKINVERTNHILEQETKDDTVKNIRHGAKVYHWPLIFCCTDGIHAYHRSPIHSIPFT